MVDPAIRIHSAVTGYPSHNGPAVVTRLNGIAFRRGEFVAVVGKNGTGKSTLLRSICGFQPLLAGSVLVEGGSVADYREYELARKLAVVLTERVGGFNLTVRDVVANGQMPYTDAFHRLRSEHLAKIDDAMKRCGVYEYSHKPVSELSDGMFQKTMIARAVAQETAILLLDEPTAFLDYASRYELFAFLRSEAVQNGKCVLISTHELDLALKYCTGLLALHGSEASLVSIADAGSDKYFREIAGGYLP